MNSHAWPIGQRPQVADQGGEVGPVDVFEHQVAAVVGLVGVEGGDDVRVNEPGRRPHFALKELPGPLRPRQVGGEHLERHDPPHVACSALNTRPMPPRPTSSRMRYWPRTKPLVRPASRCSAWNRVISPSSTRKRAMTRPRCVWGSRLDGPEGGRIDQPAGVEPVRNVCRSQSEVAMASPRGRPASRTDLR